MSAAKGNTDATNGEGDEGIAGGGVAGGDGTAAALPPCTPEPGNDVTKAVADRRILLPGETASFVVPAQSEAFHTGINLEANAQYTFAIAADATWQDWHMPPCGPEGYKSPWYMRPAEWSRKIPAANWLALIGTIDDLRQTAFLVKQPRKTYLAPHGGELVCFANDCTLLPWFYANNAGEIKVAITRIVPARDQAVADHMQTVAEQFKVEKANQMLGQKQTAAAERSFRQACVLALYYADASALVGIVGLILGAILHLLPVNIAPNNVGAITGKLVFGGLWFVFLCPIVAAIMVAAKVSPPRPRVVAVGGTESSATQAIGSLAEATADGHRIASEAVITGDDLNSDKITPAPVQIDTKVETKSDVWQTSAFGIGGFIYSYVWRLIVISVILAPVLLFVFFYTFNMWIDPKQIGLATAIAIPYYLSVLVFWWMLSSKIPFKTCVHAYFQDHARAPWATAMRYTWGFVWRQSLFIAFGLAMGLALYQHTNPFFESNPLEESRYKFGNEPWWLHIGWPLLIFAVTTLSGTWLILKQFAEGALERVDELMLPSFIVYEGRYKASWKQIARLWMILVWRYMVIMSFFLPFCIILVLLWPQNWPYLVGLQCLLVLIATFKHVASEQIGLDEFKTEREKDKVKLLETSELSKRDSRIDADMIDSKNLEACEELSANFSGIDLSSVKFNKLTLSECSFERCNLSRAEFKGSRFEECSFAGSDCRGANFSEATGLQSANFEGANLAGAILPKEYSPGDLKGIEQTCQIASQIHTILVGACIYVWITANRTQPEIGPNAAQLTLPIVNTPIPSSGFFVLGPVVILVFSIYFQLYLQKLWKQLAVLPAVYPDGSFFTLKIYPWVLSAPAEMASGILKREGKRTSYSWLAWAVTIVSSWVLIPVTILFFWLGYLKSQDAFGTMLQSVLLGLSVYLSMYFYESCMVILKVNGSEGDNEGSSEGQQGTRMRAAAMSGLAVTAIFTCSSVLALENARLFIGRVGIASWLYADFHNKDLSTRVANWKQNPDQVIGADLVNKGLHGADMRGCFLAKANLRNTRLQNSLMQGAILDGSECDGTQFNGAFFDANTSLAGISTQDCSFDHALFRGTSIGSSGETWQNATFRQCGLQVAKLKSNFDDCDFTGAEFLGCEASSVAFSNCNFDSALIGWPPEETGSGEKIGEGMALKFLRHQLDADDRPEPKWTNVVFKGGSYNKTRFEQEFVNCRFSSVNLIDCKFEKAKFTNCTFVKVKATDPTKMKRIGCTGEILPLEEADEPSEFSKYIRSLRL